MVLLSAPSVTVNCADAVAAKRRRKAVAATSATRRELILYTSERAEVIMDGGKINVRFAAVKEAARKVASRLVYGSGTKAGVPEELHPDREPISSAVPLFRPVAGY